jgi:hypothetical protein
LTPATVEKVTGEGDVKPVVTLNVTVTVVGFTPFAVLESVIVPVFTPAGARDGLTATVIAAPPVVPVALPAPLTVSQLPVLDAVAVYGTEELGEVVTASGCVGGTAAFTELNVIVDGVPTRLLVTVRFTVTVGVGLPVAAQGLYEELEAAV